MFKFLVIVGMFLASTSAFASLICSSEGKFGAFTSVVITEKGDGGAMVSGSASGGMAHWMSVFGPYESTKTVVGDAVIYTFTDQFNQTGTVSIVGTNVDGQLLKTATTNYGMWSIDSLECK